MNEVKQTIGLSHGVISEPYWKQAKAQGLLFDKEKLKHFDRLREALSDLRMYSILSDTEASKAAGRLHNKVIACIAKTNKLKKIKPTK